jgi:hypothetical protein
LDPNPRPPVPPPTPLPLFLFEFESSPWVLLVGARSAHLKICPSVPAKETPPGISISAACSATKNLLFALNFFSNSLALNASW